MKKVNIRRIIRDAIDSTLKDDALEGAIQYVRDNHSWTDEEEEEALKLIEYYRCGIDYASYNISNEIVDLMNEYGMENGLGEDWWDGDTDNIFRQL